MPTDLLFLTLNVFSATGGIEKVCRIAGKGFYENSLRKQYRFKMYSLHDPATAGGDNPYLPQICFTGFGRQKRKFISAAVAQGRKSKVVVLSHINLLAPAFIIKKLSPRTKIILLAHGIEIWNELPPIKKRLLQCVDKIMSVSAFTNEMVQQVQQIPAAKCRILNNCLDPYLPLPKNIQPGPEFYTKYQTNPGDKIIFTLTRLASTEHYKGYDIVLKALKELNDPSVKYILAGKYDTTEYTFLQELITSLGLSSQVILPGFIAEEDIGKLFSIATVYAMPSSKEGFGIVFIEAMFYGLPVIAGNADGSTDALLQGKLGTLVNPQNVAELTAALKNILANPAQYKPNADLLCRHFSYDAYKTRLNEMVERELKVFLPRSHKDEKI